MTINYSEEVKKLDSFVPGENGKFWKPKTGQYKVRSLTELEDTEPFIDKKDSSKAPKAQVKIDLLVGEEKVIWTMAKGVSPACSYGQLCSLAIKNNGTLKNLDFMIVVTSDGKKNTYTIVKL
jgi:hypothetical protein